MQITPHWHDADGDGAEGSNADRDPLRLAAAMPAFTHESVSPVVACITVLVADHPHLTHLVSTGAAKAWGRRLSFRLRFEHGLLGLAVGSGHGH